MRFLYRYSMRRPKRVIVAAVLLTMAVAPGAARLRIRTDGNALLPTGADEIQVDREIRDAFGVRDQIAVVIRSDDPHGVYNLHTTTLLRDWTKRFAEIEGIGPDYVVSLATEKSDRVFQGTLRNRGFLDPPPRTRRELDQARSDVRRIQLFTGTLVSYDDTAAAILIGVPAEADRTRLHRELLDIIDEAGPIPEDVYVVGAPIAESLLGTHILEDLGVPAAVTGHHIVRGDEASGRHWPRSAYELRVLIGRYVGLVPIAIIIMAGVFLVSFRSVAATLLPLGEVGACLVFVFGLMGWCGVPVYLTIAVLPIILTAMGIADEIHIFSRYRQHLRDEPGGDHTACVAKTMDEMWRPVVKTSVTTAVGFMSFVLSPIAPVRAFGSFTAVGIIFCMVWSLTVIPACLVLIRPKRFVRPVTQRAEGIGLPRASLFERAARVIVRLRYVSVLAAIAVTVAALFGVRHVVVQDSWIDGFARDSGFYKATQLVNRLFHGTHILLVCVDAGHSEVTGSAVSRDVDHFRARVTLDAPVDPEALVGQWLRICPPAVPDGGAGGPQPKRGRTPRSARIETAEQDGDKILIETNRKHGTIKPLPAGRDGEGFSVSISPRRLLLPEVIRPIERLENFIASHGEDAVGGVIGPADYLSTVNYMTGGKDESRRRIPADARQARWLWRQYERVRGKHRLREILDENDARGLITVFLENADYQRTEHLMEDLRAVERSQLAEHGLSLSFAGDVAVSQALIRAIVRTQVVSLLLSLLGILAITALMGRSLGWGICCVLPCCMAVLINFAVMGVLHIPLGVATSMFSAMTLGIGVDFAIHLTERFRHAAARGLVPVEAVVDAIKATGPAIILDGLAIALGFGVMVMSQVPSNARLGGLVVLSVVVCLLVTLFALPALLVFWQPAALRSRSCGEDRPSGGPAAGIGDAAGPAPRRDG